LQSQLNFGESDQGEIDYKQAHDAKFGPWDTQLQPLLALTALIQLLKEKSCVDIGAVMMCLCLFELRAAS